MVIAYHIIFSAYGFWLPNDPRGSWSDFVRSFELLKHGRATKTTDRKSLAHDEHDREARQRAKEDLHYEPVIFTGIQAREIARGFARAVRESNYLIHACSIMPDHVHAVIARHSNSAERIMAHLKTRATQQLLTSGHHPFQHLIPASDKRISCWTSRGWKVFLDQEDDVRLAIEYVENNPVKDGLRKQTWNFVHPIDPENPHV